LFDNAKVNQIWLADFCFLTRRYAYSGVSNRYYNPNPSRTEWRGQWHKKGLKRFQTYFPKWSKYTFDSSQFRKGTRIRATDKVKVYDRPVVMFAIMDAASRFIIHAHLKQAPDALRSFAFPSFFNLDRCFKDSFKFQERLGRFGHPIRFFLDGYIYQNYSTKLKDEAFSLIPVRQQNHFLLSPLDGFFGRIQYEMRKDLTQSNLTKYIHYYNYERKHSALKTSPSTVFFDDSKEVYFNMRK
jgi:hypothetical protein